MVRDPFSFERGGLAGPPSSRRSNNNNNWGRMGSNGGKQMLRLGLVAMKFKR